MKKVIVCIHRRANPTKPSCGTRDGVEIANLIEQGIAEQQIDISVERFKCLGQCEIGPNLRISPNGEFCHHVEISDVPVLLQKIRTFVDETSQ